MGQEEAMAQDQVTRPSLAVIGIGDYYSKLKPYLWKYFSPAALVDVDHSVVKRLAAHESSVFHQLSSSVDIVDLVKPADLVMVLTPNDSHVGYCEQVSRAGKALFVEKPVATNREGLAVLGKLVDSGLPVYFSDFYVDVRATPLLLCANRLPLDDWRRNLIRGDFAKTPSVDDIGPIRRRWVSA